MRPPVSGPNSTAEPQRATPADPTVSRGRGSGTRPPRTPSSATLGGPPHKPDHPPFPNSRTPEVVSSTQSYLHDDSGTAIPSKTPDSPAPEEKTKDTQSAPHAPSAPAEAEGTERSPNPEESAVADVSPRTEDEGLPVASPAPQTQPPPQFGRFPSPLSGPDGVSRLRQ